MTPIDRAMYAKQLLDNPLYKLAHEQLREGITAKLEADSKGQEEKLVMILKANAQFKSILKSIIYQGKLEAKKLAKKTLTNPEGMK